MTVSVQEDRGIDGRRVVVRYMALEELAEKKCPLPKAGSALVVRKQSVQLVAEHRRAARFEDNDRQTGIDGRCEPLHDVHQVLLRRGKKTEIVQRTPAADMTTGRDDVAASTAHHGKR